MIVRTISLILFSLMFFSCFGQDQSIGILRDYKVKRITFSHHLGTYSIQADNSAIGTLEAQQFVEVELIGGGVDEAPMAYKDIEQVMDHQRELVEVVGTFTPKIVRMDS